MTKTSSDKTITVKQKIALISFSLFSLFIVFEFGLRSYDFLNGRGFFSIHRKWGQLRVFKTREIKRRPFRTFGADIYKEIEGTKHTVSTHGELYPLDKPEGTFRIICFGESTTQSQKSVNRNGNHYPLLLQSMLRERLAIENIEVINMGYSAYATAYSMILLELNGLFSWQPD